jgi:hypothetical protein
VEQSSYHSSQEGGGVEIERMPGLSGSLLSLLLFIWVPSLGNGATHIQGGSAPPTPPPPPRYALLILGPSQFN